MADTQYARCGDLSIAYQLFGDGPVDVVFASSFVSHVEVMWTSPEIKSFFDRMAAFSRVVIFDKAGVGLSDPIMRYRSIEERAEEIDAVMNAVGFERPVLMGVSEGGPAAMLYAASHPERVQALVLTGTFPCVVFDSWADVDAAPSELHARAVEMLGEEFAPSAEQLARFLPFAVAVRDEWGSGVALSNLLPSLPRAQLGMLERMSASPGMARATGEALFRLDVRDILPAINVPTLVIHAKDEAIPVECGRYLAARIPGAQLLEVQGADHAPWLTEPDVVLSSVEEFLTGTHTSAPVRRALRTVLFTDMVSSTQRAAAMGDDRWHALLDRFDSVTRSTIARFGGTVVKSMGDGHLATIDGPAQAIRCAEALRTDVGALDVEIRAGIHTGECELMGDDIGGLAVHIGARVMSQAGASEILVSSTVRDLVVGSGFGFDDRGTHELKGVPGQWQLLAVRPEGAPAGSPEAALYTQPTPSPRQAMRRSDRAVAAIAHRAPGLIRGVGRLVPNRK
ncbi:MAG TPA: adenylate/guanylate cyclase domain-containing protein [Acidimicrobiales bacterium]|nr:adenylate/guanylate cyclase domain-containing protein [Acidimicrobiales bacterium]